MSKYFYAADSIILAGCLDTPWSNLDHLNDVSRAAKLATVLEHCFDYFVNGRFGNQLKKCLSAEGVREYFREKLFYLMHETSGVNALGSNYLKCRPSSLLFLQYVSQALNHGHIKNVTLHVGELMRKHLLEVRDKERDSFERGARKNRESIRMLLSSIFRAHSKVLVLRIDVWYDYCAGIESKSSGVPRLNRDSIYHIDMHRKEFIKHLRNTYGKKLLGYVWRLEYGISRGFHLHFLILIDGQSYAQDVNHGMALGEHWRTVITNGQGGYYNCNAKKNAYQHLAIGMISYDDKEKKDAIEKIARYFTKNDLLFQAVTYNKSYRTFGRSGLVKPPSNRGRKRAKTF